MNKINNTINQKHKLFLFCLCLLTIFFGVYLFLNKINIFSYDPYRTIWNDEVFLYKHLESIINYGYPRGYFGYNLSHAKIGGFGAWIPILLYAYAPLYFIIRNPISIVITNILLIVGSYAFLIYNTKNMSVRKIIAYTLPIISCCVIRYIFSGMMETFFVAGIIIIFACYLNRDKKSFYLTGLIAIGILTAIRPYMALLFIFYTFENKFTWKWILKTLGLMIGTVLIYFIIVSLFCAKSYDAPLVEVENMLNASNGIISFITYNCYNLVRNVWNRILFIFRSISGGVQTEVFGASLVYFLYLITLVLLLVKTTLSYKKESFKKLVILSLSVIIMFVAVCWLNSNPTAGNRHLSPMMLFAWLYLISISKNNIVIYIAALFVLVINIFFYKDPFYQYQQLDNTAYQDEKLKELSLGENMEDNTIAFEYGVDNQMYLALKDIPAGFGINLCFQDNEVLDPNNMTMKYVMLAKESSNVEKYKNNDEFIELINNDEFIIFMRGDN